MYAYSPVKVVLGGSFEHKGSEPLCDLTGMWTKVMESNNFAILSSVSDQLGIAIIPPIVIKIPLQRFEGTSVSNNILGPEDFPGLFLGVTTTSILDWREDGGGNVFVAHQSCFVVE